MLSLLLKEIRHSMLVKASIAGAIVTNTLFMSGASFLKPWRAPSFDRPAFAPGVRG